MWTCCSFSIIRLSTVASPQNRHIWCWTTKIFKLQALKHHKVAFRITSSLSKWKDTEIEDKKSIGLLSLGYLDLNGLFVPQNIFKNSLTWKFYESFKFLAFRTWVILWLLPSLYWIMSSKWVYSFMISLFVLFFEPIFLPVIHVFFS